MSVFDGEIEFQTVYMVDYVKKKIPKPTRSIPHDDDCLIVGVSRDALKARPDRPQVPDKLCPLVHEPYKNAVKRFEEDYPKLSKKYMREDIDPTPIDNEIQDRKRTEYLVKYCSRELPFMSVNLARRARALQTLQLPDDVDIPDTSQKSSYRPPTADKYELPSSNSCRPKFDNSLRKELHKILRVQTGESTYTVMHGLLGKVVLEKNPFGPPREEPGYGRWRNPYLYTYPIRN